MAALNPFRTLSPVPHGTVAQRESAPPHLPEGGSDREHGLEQERGPKRSVKRRSVKVSQEREEGKERRWMRQRTKVPETRG